MVAKEGAGKPHDVFYDVNKRSIKESIDIWWWMLLLFSKDYVHNHQRKKSLKFLLFFCCHHNGYNFMFKRLFCVARTMQKFLSLQCERGKWNKHWSIKHLEQAQNFLPVIKWFIIFIRQPLILKLNQQDFIDWDSY